MQLSKQKISILLKKFQIPNLKGKRGKKHTREK
jgi:hypothetical protein